MSAMCYTTIAMCHEGIVFAFSPFSFLQVGKGRSKVHYKIKASGVQ